MTGCHFYNLIIVSWANLQVPIRGLQPKKYSHGICSLRRRFLLPSTCFRSQPHEAAGQQRFYSTTIQNCSYNDDHQKDLIPSAAREAFSVLAKRGKTWRRMKHLVILAQEAQKNIPNLTTIVDVGTDHGMLPIALAASGQFEKVMGVDVSEQVLRDGALTLYQEVTGHLELFSDETPLTVDFCCGNGLETIDHADIVCIAGMGVNTMHKIITPSELDRVHCKVLLLQPTNSKPRNLTMLYNKLQQSGWQLANERIETVSSRWYISASFTCHPNESTTDLPVALPGTILNSLDPADDDKATFEEYVKHHCNWLEQDMHYQSGLTDDETRWFKAFCG